MLGRSGRVVQALPSLALCSGGRDSHSMTMHIRFRKRAQRHLVTTLLFNLAQWVYQPHPGRLHTAHP